MIIVRITMNTFLDKRTEVMQTLLSMIEPTENERGCLSFHAFRDLEDKNGFDLITEWETREDLDHYIRSDIFSVLLGTKSLLCEPPRIEIHTVSHSEGMETVNSVRGEMSIIGIIRYTENSGLQVRYCIGFGKQCLNPAINKIDGLCFFLYCTRTNHQKILGI